MVRPASAAKPGSGVASYGTMRAAWCSRVGVHRSRLGGHEALDERLVDVDLGAMHRHRGRATPGGAGA